MAKLIFDVARNHYGVGDFLVQELGGTAGAAGRTLASPRLESSRIRAQYPPAKGDPVRPLAISGSYSITSSS
jgi:hypothetical protein